MEPDATFRPLLVEVEVELPMARLQLVQLSHRHPSEHEFHREGIYWIDLCLTPRRPNAFARYVDRWGPHRFSELGPIIALPPGERLHLKHEGGPHASLLCQMRAEAVQRWFPKDFAWTDRRLENCLHISSEKMRWLLLRLNQELRSPGVGTRKLLQALVTALSIELARYITSVNELPERGGLASWRLRVIDHRIAEQGEPPTLSELAKLCRISIRQLTRGFRTSRGCSISDHLAEVRIETAKRRLTTSESIKNIAESMGYASQSNFTAAFRRATGVTPNQYRKRAGTENAFPDRRKK